MADRKAPEASADERVREMQAKMGDVNPDKLWLLKRFAMRKQSVVHMLVSKDRLYSSLDIEWLPPDVTLGNDEDANQSLLNCLSKPGLCWDLLPNRSFIKVVNDAFKRRNTHSEDDAVFAKCTWCWETLLWYYRFDNEAGAKSVLYSLQHGLPVPDRYRKKVWILPFGLICERSLYLIGMEKLLSLPDNLYVRKNLWLQNLDQLRSVGKGITVEGDIYLLHNKNSKMLSRLIEKIEFAGSTKGVQEIKGNPKVHMTNDLQDMNDTSPHRLFIMACFVGNIDKVQKHFREFEKNCTEEEYNRALSCACQGLNLTILQILLSCEKLSLTDGPLQSLKVACIHLASDMDKRCPSSFFYKNLLWYEDQSDSQRFLKILTRSEDDIVVLKDEKTIFSLPDGLSLDSLTLHCLENIKLVADGLIVNELKIHDCPSLEKLGEDLQVNDLLTISRCPRLEAVPRGLFLRELRLLNLDKLEKIPDQIHCEELYIEHCNSLTGLPPGLWVRKALEIVSCQNFSSLPNTLRLKRMRLEKLPALQVIPAGIVVSTVELYECTQINTSSKGSGILENLYLRRCTMFCVKEVECTLWVPMELGSKRTRAAVNSILASDRKIRCSAKDMDRERPNKLRVSCGAASLCCKEVETSKTIVDTRCSGGHVCKLNPVICSHCTRQLMPSKNGAHPLEFQRCPYCEAELRWGIANKYNLMLC